MLDKSFRTLKIDGARDVEFEGSEIKRMGSAGAWLILRAKHQLTEGGAKLRALPVRDGYGPLLENLERETRGPPPPPPPYRPFTDFLARMGRGRTEMAETAYSLLGLVGRITVETFEAIVRPTRELPWPAFVNQIEATGLTAIPIVGLLSFLLGVVLAYQGAEQLRRFGAEIFTVNLVGLSVLREIGVLITAIIAAGRSGSAFTAQIGTMKLNEEVDAMVTMGLNPIEILVLPRVLGLLVALPLLTFYANIMGLIGGAVMCYFNLDITFPAFSRQLQGAISFSPGSFWLGIIKPPFFAFTIALVGCFEGLRVEGTAESVGRMTQR